MVKNISEKVIEVKTTLNEKTVDYRLEQLESKVTSIITNSSGISDNASGISDNTNSSGDLETSWEIRNLCDSVLYSGKNVSLPDDGTINLPVAFKLKMFDSAGKLIISGNSYEMSESGIIINDLQVAEVFADGYFGEITITNYNFDNTSLDWESGSWENETSWEITNLNDSVLYSGENGSLPDDSIINLPVEFKLKMFDDNGDGWDGGSKLIINGNRYGMSRSGIIINGSQVAEITITDDSNNGSFGEITITDPNFVYAGDDCMLELCQGDPYCMLDLCQGDPYCMLDLCQGDPVCNQNIFELCQGDPVCMHDLCQGDPDCMLDLCQGNPVCNQTIMDGIMPY